ncbi:MAG: 2-C-methyl-D-erythritol 4-phosphate cytidylyltransferase [Marinilabiliaceae bacterium]|nr:2-C-methyl-D-erythritol 4-phosphate cytidylyltransferase [Marinilabiliaceae bacterium]
MNYYAVIVAGGSGKRMGTDIPKQFLLLKGRPVLMHTIERFHNYKADMHIIVVLPYSQIERWGKLCQEYDFHIDHDIVHGGATRFESVKNGLKAVKDDGIVAVHDGVRPLVSTQTINRTFIEAAAYGSAIPVTDSTQSVRFIDDGGVSHSLNRSQVVLVQTPQTFKTSLLLSAYEQDFSASFTDDASVVEAAGAYVHLTHGNIENVKITTKDDMLYAEVIMSSGLVS